MFTWLNKQGVRSDAGFEFQRTGRFEAEYREGGKVVTLSVESGMIGGMPCIIVDPDAFQQWDSPQQQIPAETQARMFRNLRDAIEFQGLKLVIERGESPLE